MQVKLVMQSPVNAVDLDAPIGQAASLMSTCGLRQLPVKQGAGVVGLVSERAVRRAEPSTLPSLAAWESSGGRDGVRVRDVMSAPTLTVAADADVTEAASMLVANRLDALPVVEGSEVVGLVRVRDLLGVLGQDVARPRRPRLGHILAVLDEDPGSDTLATAVSLTRHHDARLTLVCVLPPVPQQHAAEMSAVSWESIRAQRKGDARAWLASQASDTPEGRVADVVVAEGDLTAEVLALAGAREVDLIVVGARAAAPMIARSVCPVLGVPRTRRGRHARR